MIGFLVTSAINTRFGVFDTEQRLQQTLDTIASIKVHAADATIILLELGATPLTDEQRKTLAAQTSALIEFSNDELVKKIAQQDNWDIVKNATEILCFRHALDLIQKSDISKDITRYVKVSGRYLLNEEFDINLHSAHSKIVFATKRQSQFPPAVTGGSQFQYMSRCWSFPASELDYVKKTFYDMLSSMEKALQRGGYLDIEHLLYLSMESSKIIEVNKIGVQGLLGPNGILVKD